MRTICLVWLALLAPNFVSAQLALTPVEGKDYSSRVEIVPKRSFTEPELMRRSRSLVKSNSLRFLDVWFLVSKADAGLFFDVAKPVDMFYDFWFSLYEQVRNVELPVAELVVINGSATLRIRRGNGNAILSVLTGPDPLLVEAGGQQLRILYFALSPVAPNSHKHQVSVFAQTLGPLENGIGASAILELQKRLPFEDISLYIRHDPWFCDNPFYLVLPAFDLEFAVPTREQFRVSEEFWCSVRLNHPVVCRRSDRHD